MLCISAERVLTGVLQLIDLVSANQKTEQTHTYINIYIYIYIYLEDYRVSPTDIDFQELSKRCETKELFIVDVRTPEEVDTLGMVPNSVHVDSELGGTYGLRNVHFSLNSKLCCLVYT